MQPVYKPKPVYKSKPKRTEEEPALASTLVCSFARVVRGSASFEVVDQATSERFLVEIKPLRAPMLDENAKVLYMKAGPAGETCSRCHGSGVTD